MNERETPPENAANTARILMGMLGGLLVGSGLIAMLAHNWDNHPRWIRLSCAFLPLLVAQVGTFLAIYRTPPAPVWVREALALLQTLATGACIAIVSQIYNLGGAWPDFLFWWFILCLPLVWVTRSTAVVVFYLWATAQWSVHQCDNRVWHQGAMIYPLLLAGLFPFWPGKRLNNPLSIPLRWVMSLSVLTGMSAAAYAAVQIREHWRGIFDGAECLWSLTAGAMMLVPLSRDSIVAPLRHKPHVVIGGMITVGVSLFITVEGAAYWSKSFLDAFGIPWMWFLVAIMTVFATAALRARRWLLVAVAYSSVIPALVSIGLGASAIQWLTVSHLFVVGAFSIGVELAGRKGAPLLGCLLICALVAGRFWDSEQSLIAKGITFLVAGAALLAVATIASDKRRPTRP